MKVYLYRLIAISAIFFSLSAQTLAQESTPVNNPAEPPKPATRLPGNTPRARIPQNEDKSMVLLAKSLPEDAPIWLTTADERFLGIWQRDRSGDPKGALFIIHAEGENPSWPNTTQPLHNTLPDYGWATLAISLPVPEQPPHPQRTAPVKTFLNIGETPATAQDGDKPSATSTPAPATTAPAKPPQKPISAMTETIAEKRLESALRFLHDQGQFNIILLGNGFGAIRASDFLKKITPKVTNPKLKEKLEKPVSAIVIVNGRNRLPTMKASYKHWFSDPEVPVLDIFINTDNRNRGEAKDRKTLARQKRVATYKQVKINNLTHTKSWGENLLSRRIRSFLDANAAGIEVKNAKVK